MKNSLLLLIFIFSAFTGYSQGTWTQKTSCPATARYRCIAFVVNGNCYIGTGSTGSTNTQNDIWEYDVTNDTWAQKADFPGAPRINATACASGGYGYVGLGANNSVLQNDWYQYDPIANSWAQKMEFAGGKRFGSFAFELLGRIFVGGGLDSSQTTALNTMYAYDPVNDSWGPKANIPIGVSSPASFVMNGKAYVITGALNGSTIATTQNVEYDATNDSWTPLAAYPPGNTFSAFGFSLNGYGYVGTGFTGNLTDVVYRYDRASDMWTQETSWPTGIRQWTVSASTGTRAFVGTGNSTGGNLFNDWWEFTAAVSTSIDGASNNAVVYYDAASNDIVIKNMTGTSSVRMFSSDGKLVLDKEVSGDSRIPFTGQGVYLLSLNGKQVRKLFID